MKYFTGKDYPHLCTPCKAAIDAMVDILPELPEPAFTSIGYVGDEEGPLMAAHDQGLLRQPDCNLG